MKASKGQANPQLVNQLLKQELDKTESKNHQTMKI